MKTTIRSLGMAALAIGLLTGGCARKQSTMWESLKDPETVKQLKQFVAEKEAQADAAAKADGNKMLPEFKSCFTAAANGDWLAVSNDFENFRKRSGDFDHPGPTDERLRGPQWQAVKEVWGGFCAFNEGDEKYSAVFGNDIIESIPPDSIYCGGTDAGRFIVTAMQKSQVNGDPFFTLTQNALADGSYLDYLRTMYGEKIYIPTANDSQNCFQSYIEDAKRRLLHDQQSPNDPKQVKPGEDVKMGADGLIQVSGQVAVMEINGLLVKVTFDKNPGREFYIEESFPFDWMYPQLEPHGLILKINRQPLPTLSDEILERDHAYWTKLVSPMIGDWLHDDTPVGEVAAFAGKVHSKHNLGGFTGDPRFVQNYYAMWSFSKLRSSIAGIYMWRVNHSTDTAEKERMAREADFAFRQAWALCPYSYEAIFRYVNFLLEQKRVADALVVAETAAQMPALQGKDGEQMRALVEQLKKYQKSKQVNFTKAEVASGQLQPNDFRAKG